MQSEAKRCGDLCRLVGISGRLEGRSGFCLGGSFVGGGCSSACFLMCGRSLHRFGEIEEVCIWGWGFFLRGWIFCRRGDGGRGGRRSSIGGSSRDRDSKRWGGGGRRGGGDGRIF